MPKWRVRYESVSKKDYEIRSNYLEVDNSFYIFYDEDVNVPKLILKSSNIHFVSDKDELDDNDTT